MGEDYRPIGVWLDYENALVPSGSDASSVTKGIRFALQRVGMKGSMKYHGFGDLSKVSQEQKDAQAETGFELFHVSSSADSKIITSILFWALHNPKGIVVLISGKDGDYSPVVNQLAAQFPFTIVVVHSPQPNKRLINSADYLWSCQDMYDMMPPYYIRGKIIYSMSDKEKRSMEIMGRQHYVTPRLIDPTNYKQWVFAALGNLRMNKMVSTHEKLVDRMTFNDKSPDIVEEAEIALETAIKKKWVVLCGPGP